MPIITVTLPNDGETADASDVDDPIEAILAVVNGGLDQDNLADGGVTNAKLAGGITSDKLADSAKSGWSDLSNAINSVTNNGNRSYDLVVNTTDLTSKLSNGMRIRLPRASTPNGQCTSLNGSSQYWSLGSPSGITFTDDFTVSAWIKVAALNTNDAIIISRTDGSSGWWFGLDNTGKVVLNGSNAGASNFRRVTSVQSIPLNRWVKVSAELDMFGFTTSTCKIQIDDVDAPATVTANGTSPTSLIQAGTLEIGSINGGGNKIQAEIKEVSLFNALISASTLATYSGQSMTGSETNCIGLWKFAGNGNDTSGSGNNLTANGSATATTADAPFNTTEYGILMNIAFSTNTTMTVSVPEGYSLPTSGGFGTISYSGLSVPYGFPKQSRKWDVRAEYRGVLSTGIGSINTNVSSGFGLNVPKGAWTLNWQGTVEFSSTGSGTRDAMALLSVGAIAVGGEDNLSATAYAEGAANALITGNRTRDIILTDPTTCTMYGRINQASGSESWAIRGDGGREPFIVKAINGYL